MDLAPLHFSANSKRMTVNQNLENASHLQQQLTRIENILKAIRGINRLLVQEKDPQAIIMNVCNILYKTREYHSVWIALTGNNDQLLGFASSNKGEAIDGLQDLIKKKKWPGMLLEAKKKKGLVVVENPEVTCQKCPMSKLYSNCAAYVMPLIHNDIVYGYISASVPKELAASITENEIFFEMAQDIGSALGKLSSEYDFIQLFEDAPDAFVLVDKSLNIFDVNPAFTDIIGLSREEVVGKNSVMLAKKLLNLPNLLKVLPVLKSMVSGKRVSQFELKYKNKDLAISSSFRGNSKYHIAIIRDITEFNKNKRAVIENEAKYRNLVESLDDSVFIMQDGLIKYVNESLCRVSGYSRQEVLGKDFTLFIMSEKVSKAVSYYKDRMQGKPVPNKYQSVAKRKDGTFLDVEVTTISVDYDGKPAFQIVLRDITTQKKAEKELKASEEKFRFLSTSTFEGIVVHKRGRVLDVNEAFLKLTGYQREEVIGEQLLDYLTSVADKAKVLLNIAKPSAVPYTVKARKKDGTHFVSELEGKDVIHQGQKVRIAAVRDVTERFHLQKQIVESERKLKTLIDNLPGVAYRCINSPSWPMEFLSDGCFHLTGYRPEEIVEKNIVSYGDIIHPEDAPMVWDEIQHAIDRNEPFEIEYRIITQKGKEKWVWERGRCVENNKKVVLEGFITDVTKSKLAESTIKESEKRFKQIFDLAPTGIAESKSDGFISVNEKMCDIFGYTREELLSGMNFSQITHPDDLEKSNSVTKASIDHPGKVFTMDKRYFRKDGTVIWGRIYLTGVAYDSGKFKHHLISIQDVTHYKQVEDEMRLFKKISDKALYGSGIIDMKRNLVYVNDYFAHIHGYQPDELLGNDLSLFHSKEQLNETSTIINEILSRGSMETREVGHMHKNGTLFSMLMSFVLIHDELDQPKYIAATAIDLTEVKNAQKNLKLSESKFKALFNGVSDAVLVHPFNKEGFHCFTEVNNVACDRYGYTRDEWLALSPKDITLHDDSIKYGSKKRRSDLETNKWSIFEARHLTKTGKQFPVEISSRIFEIEGEPIIISLVRDITEQKQAENELKESANKFRSIFENKGTATAIIDVKGKILLANEKCALISGYSVAELQNGLGWMDLTHKEDFPLLLARKENPGSAKKDHEARLIKKDGSIKNVFVNIDVMPNQKDRVVSLIDITYRKEAELKLKHSERKFRSYIQNAPYGIFIADEKGNYQDVNIEAEKITGYTFDELIRMNLLELIAPEHKQLAIENFQNFVASGIHETVELKYIRKNGQEKYWSISAVKISDVRYLGFATDVTERIENQMRLISLFNDQKVMLDNDPTLIFFKDTENNILRVTDSVAKMTGLSRDQIEGQPSKLIYPDLAEKYWQEDLEVIRSGKPKMNIVEPLHNIKGEVMWLLTNKMPFRNDKNEIVGIIVFSTDITKLIIAEEELLQKNKELIKAKNQAEESDRLKSAFLANMSHEIRTPMNGILGFASLLKEPDISGEKQMEYVKIIQRSGDRMLSTINDLVDISRIEAGQVQVYLTEVDIDKMVRDLYDFFQQECLAKNIRLSTSVDMLSSYIIYSDAHKLNSILTNLIKNAIKFTDSGSIGIDYYKKGQMLHFTIEDTGIGIPVERQQAVFDRFVQADIADSRAYQGSGLGLSIIKSYVEMLGGEVHLESEVGVGSKFMFSIPVNKVPSDSPHQDFKEKESLMMPSLPQRKIKILIAEDDEPSFIHLSILIKGVVSDVLHAQTGIEAVSICREHPDIDLVLMDIKMPEMDGLTATKEIRQFNTKVIIIAQTAYALTGDKEKVMEAGCNNYITKPIQKDDLLDMIRSLVVGQEKK